MTLTLTASPLTPLLIELLRDADESTPIDVLRMQFGFICPPADFDEALSDASHSGWIIQAEPGNVRLA